MKQIGVFHVFTDDKFFDQVAEYFDSFSDIVNYYYFYSRDKDYQFKYIKSKKVVVVSSWFEYVKLMNDRRVDVVYLQGMSSPYICIWVSRAKKIVWWCHGIEIYCAPYFLKPIIPLDLYKPLTKLERKRQLRKRGRIRVFIGQIYYLLFVSFFKKLSVRRVDYFSPVLPIDYELMKKYFNGFKAKPFMLNGGPGLRKEYFYKYKINRGAILVGNSLTYENNHLDIFEKFATIQRSDCQQLIVPINYGNGYGGVEYFKNIVRLSNVFFIDTFLPRDKYFTLLEGVTHAVFGNIRQQAMGNIFWCLRSGIKVYLYRDSVIYKQLKRWGYIIFSIDADLCTISLNEVLLERDAYHNCEVYNMMNLQVSTVEQEFRSIFI